MQFFFLQIDIVSLKSFSTRKVSRDVKVFQLLLFGSSDVAVDSLMGTMLSGANNLNGNGSQ